MSFHCYCNIQAFQMVCLKILGLLVSSFVVLFRSFRATIHCYCNIQAFQMVCLNTHASFVVLFRSFRATIHTREWPAPSLLT